MDTKELAKSIYLLRRTLMPESAALAVVNALVQLVGEMEKAMHLYMADGDDGDIEMAIVSALTKASPIAKLAKEK